MAKTIKYPQMKLVTGVTDEQLKELGFTIPDEPNEWSDDYEDTLVAEAKLIYNLGMSRRGQCYYLLLEKNNVFSIIATRPDGSGAAVSVDDIFFKLLTLGYAEIV